MMRLFDREGELVAMVAPFIDPSFTVLDVGAGNGKLSLRVAAGTGAELTLCDVCPHAVRGMKYLTMKSPTTLPCEDRTYDVVMMAFMLHHMDTFGQQERLLEEARRVARKRLVILEDTAIGHFEKIANRAWDFVMNAPQGIPTPFTFRSTSEWRVLIERVGFQLRHAETFRGTWPILRSYTQAVLVADVPGNIQPGS
jgi:SAM-dependent methyltransferase